MKIDIYTKCILTVIAVALVATVFQNFMSTAVAQNEIQRVAICNIDNPNYCALVRPSNRGEPSISVKN